MPAFSVQVRGLQEVRAWVRRFGTRAREAYRHAIRPAGEEMMTESKKIVPVKWGHLRDSGHVEGPEAKGNVEVMTLAFGGPAAPYADVQHERLDFRHNPPGQAKYLEKPVLKAVPGLAPQIADAMRKELEA